MRIVKKSTIIILSFIILFLIPLNITAAEITVTAEAAINSDPELARQEARQKGFQKAVEKLAGTYIRKSTLVENSKFINQQIYSKAEGYVSNYQIISEETNSSRYIIQLKAEVSRSLLSDLEELKIILETQTTNPRLLILVDDAQLETIVSDQDNQYSGVAAEIAAKFGNPQVNQEALDYPQQAAKIALGKTAQNAARITAERLVKIINFNSGQKYLKLELQNTEFEQLQKFEQVLKSLEGIRSFQLKNFSQEKAIYDLKVLQQTAVLADKFANENSLDLKISELNANYLSLTLN